MAITLFRMVGALTRNIVVANALGSLTMLLVLMMGGFVIPKQAVHPWVVWLYWAGAHLTLSHDHMSMTAAAALQCRSAL